ncbi:DUF3084 domain-containing protein [Iocasia frigidifontis]|uniref:DUF3084 domain-containing protein n=1 Tax=Iocasia fonsfrigidae TaxID=2682810 RepID=A0A8A7KG97_9FIRM|nr:DUF3084 domain-containing protein [Iocasia fonsfrigidae]QTL96902.1 DUF3084 domain-containing protein [Iocasia fonsfrigidae]
MYGILLVSVVITLSGFMAYLGDQIGMKIGKKRISLFGLRPKYTSIIITVLTGVLIATLTITVILLTNNGVRKALFNIQEVLVRLDDLNQQLAVKDRSLQDREVEIAERERELVLIQQQKTELEEKLNQNQQEFARTRQKLLATQDELTNTRSDVKELENKRVELQDTNQELNERIASLHEQRKELENKMVVLNEKIDSLNEDYEKARFMAYKYGAGLQYYREGDIVFQRGDIIYSDVIETGQTQQEIVDQLSAFLERADQKVKEYPVRVDEELGTTLQLRAEEIFTVARTIINADYDRVIVSLVASVNVPQGDWVYANFILNEDFIVFQQDEYIAECVIDADGKDIEDKLSELLTDINTRAVREGLLVDNQGDVGSIDYDEFYRLHNQILNYHGKVKIKAYAGEDIWREDRLSNNLSFEISSVEGE